MNPKKRFPKWPIFLGVVVLIVFSIKGIFGQKSFDVDSVAHSESLLWQSYYSGDAMQLRIQIRKLFTNQFGLSPVDAMEVGNLFGRSAMHFKTASGDYETMCLPDLTNAYGRIQRATGAGFDPEKAARAELAWWIARRTPGEDTAKQVGAKIAELYSILYGGALPKFEQAGFFRAEAAELRDSGGKAADWTRIEELLRQSYRELAEAIDHGDRQQ